MIGFIVGLATLSGCLDLAEPAPTSQSPTEPDAPWFTIATPVNITPPAPGNAASPGGFGSEPSILVARDGSIYIVSVLGSAEARGDGLWRSEDGGKNWTSLGKPDYPFGGGDADLDEDDAETLYLPGQWRPTGGPPMSPVGFPYITGGESMAVSKDRGLSWTTNPVASDLPVTDRQWSTTYGAGTVWLAFNQAQRGLVVTKSTDSGLTWGDLVTVEGTWDPGDGVAVSGGPNGIPGDILANPDDGTLYVPYGPGIGGGSREHRLFISEDGGGTFHSHVIHTAPDGEQAGAIFGSLARDDAGVALYYTWAESVDGGAKGVRIYLATSHDGGETWGEPQVASPEGHTAVFPWIVVGGHGKVGVAYYATNGSFLSDAAPAGQEWRPMLSLTQQIFANETVWDHAWLSPWPNHYGPICTGGTGCSSGRLLGDFFEADIDASGQVVAVWVDDTQMASGGARANVFGRMFTGSLL